jgi:hypothetical protein
MCHADGLRSKYALVALQRGLSERKEVAMTTQHVPPTPLWRQVLSLPHTRLGWWAVGLAVIASIAFVIASTIPDPEDSVNPPLWNEVLEIIVVPTAGVAPLAGGVVGALALGAGERSLLVWLAQVPAALLFAVLTSIFREGSFWVNGSPGVLVWALIATSIIFLRILSSKGLIS